MEEAFLKALQANPESGLRRAVWRAVRKQSARSRVVVAKAPRIKQLHERLRRLGQQWADLRLAGCPWLGPLSRLQADWTLVRADLALVPQVEARIDGLLMLARGIGLREGPLDSRGRSYLVRCLEQGQSAPELTIEGIRFFSAATVFVCALDDLAGHSPSERQDLRSHLAAELHGHPAPDWRTLCGAVLTWWEGQPDLGPLSTGGPLS